MLTPGEAALGRRTGGVWTRRQALAVMGRGAVAGRLRRGEWQQQWRGIYADAGHVLDAYQRAIAAVLASQSLLRDPKRLSAVATGRTAARVLGLPLIDDWDPLTGADDGLHEDVLVDRPSDSLSFARADGQTGFLHRARGSAARAELQRRRSGLWITSVPRTVLACSRVLSHEALVCLLDAALHRHLLTDDDLRSLVRRSSFLPGVGRLRQAARHSDGRAESAAESLLRLCLLPHLPGLVPQVRARDEHGRVYARYDLADEELRLAVEADGKAGHAGQRMAARDNARDRRGDSRSWRTERVTWWDLRRGRPAMVRRVLDAAARQRFRVAQLSRDGNRR